MSQANYLGVQDYPVPVGTIIPVVGIYQQYNDGFLICNGVAVRRDIWAKLFAVIGTQFGAGDGSTTFNVPNLVGSVPKGSNANSGQGAGAYSGTINYTLAETNMPSLTFSASSASFTASLQRSCFEDDLRTQTPYEDDVSNQQGWKASSKAVNSSVNIAMTALDVSYTGTGGSQSATTAGTYLPPSYQMIYLIKGQESFGNSNYVP